MLYANYAREKLHNLTLVKEAKGYPCVLLKSKGKKLKDYKIYGNSVQNGTPTPESPVEIQSVGTKTNNVAIIQSLSGIQEENGVYSTTFVDDRSQLIMKFQFRVGNSFQNQTTSIISQSGRYSISIQVPTEEWSYLRLSNSGKTIESSIFFDLPYEQYKGKTITISFTIIDYNVATFSLKDIQIEEGSTATNYEPYGYKIPITVSGKNILPLNDYEGTIGWGTFETIKVSVKPNTVYVFSIKEFERITNIDKGNTTMYIYSDASLTNVLVPLTFNNPGDTGLNTTPYKSSFNSGDNSELYFKLRNNTGTTTEVNINGMMVREYGTTSDYVPYVEPKTYNIYLDEPLRKIGDYADYIDFEKGQINRYIEKVDLGTIAWHYDVNKFYFYSSALKQRATGSTNMLCTHYPVIYQGLETGDKYTRGSTSNYIVYLKDLDYTDTTTFRSAMSGKMMYYQLLTPDTQPIELPNIPTIKGTTVLETDTNISPSDIWVKYISK